MVTWEIVFLAFGVGVLIGFLGRRGKPAAPNRAPHPESGDQTDDLWMDEPDGDVFEAGHRHRPPGQWVAAYGWVSVAGVTHRRDDVEAWAAACVRAEAMNCPYGVALEAEPDNAADPCAIKVIGWVVFDAEHSWHVGYLPRALAARVNAEITDQGTPAACELKSILTDGTIDVVVRVLRPRLTR